MSDVDPNDWSIARSNTGLSTSSSATSSTLASSDYARSTLSYGYKDRPDVYRSTSKPDDDAATWRTVSNAGESPEGTVLGADDGDIKRLESGVGNIKLTGLGAGIFERKQVLQRLLEEEMNSIRVIFRTSLEQHLQSRPEMRYRFSQDTADSVKITDQAIAIAEHISQQGHVHVDTALKMSSIGLYDFNILLDDSPFRTNPSTYRPYLTTLNPYPGLRDNHPRAPLYHIVSSIATKLYRHAFWRGPNCKFIYYSSMHPFTTEPPFDYTDISQWSGKNVNKHGRGGISKGCELGSNLALYLLSDMEEDSWQKKRAGAGGQMRPQVTLVLVHGDVQGEAEDRLPKAIRKFIHSLRKSSTGAGPQDFRFILAKFGDDPSADDLLNRISSARNVDLHPFVKVCWNNLDDLLSEDQAKVWAVLTELFLP